MFLDITQSKLIRDHVGWAWYDREFRIPKDWFSNQRIWLRFGGVNYHAIVVSSWVATTAMCGWYT